MSSAVHTAIGAVALVGQVGLKGLHHPARSAQTSNGRTRELTVGQRAQQPQAGAGASPLR